MDQNMKSVLHGDNDDISDFDDSCENVIPDQVINISKVKSSPGPCLASKRKSHQVDFKIRKYSIDIDNAGHLSARQELKQEDLIDDQIGDE